MLRLDTRRDEVCEVCKRPIDECVCCYECGHDCPLEIGETYCPVCGGWKEKETA